MAVRPRSTDSGVAWRRRPAQDGRTPERSLATRSRRAVALHARVELWRPRLSALQKDKVGAHLELARAPKVPIGRASAPWFGLCAEMWP